MGMRPSLLDRFERAVRRLNRVCVWLASALAVLIVVVILYDVTLRTVATPPVWAHDVARFALLYLFFLALGPALESGHHVVVDMFDRLLPARWRRFQTHAAAALSLIMGALLFWQTLAMTAQAIADGRLAPAAIPIPLGWVYPLGPLGAALFALTAIVQFARAIRARSTA
jgi:TRAP-type C4-dicarboxylate transport system permease small subunit